MLELCASIASALPDAHVGRLTPDPAIPASTVHVRLPNRLVLSVSNSLDQPETHFIVMRTGVSMELKLPFEQEYEDGYGVSDMLTREQALELVRSYAAFRRDTAPMLH
ncbi:hypothetical protein [Ramlibacter sp. AN1133]|uniref:hypothetical protein n=1 Tax=Ramlibacter sp. AN1133 TaxID=3133429 RepID=UPI0030C3C298